MQDMVGVRAGVLVDEPLLNEPPKIEVYADKRPAWLAKVPGAMQLSSKYEILEEGTKRSEEYDVVRG